MHSNPITSWQQWNGDGTGAIFTFANHTWVLIALCAACLALVGWFIVSAYRFEGRGRDNNR